MLLLPLRPERNALRPELFLPLGPVLPTRGAHSTMYAEVAFCVILRPSAIHPAMNPCSDSATPRDWIARMQKEVSTGARRCSSSTHIAAKTTKFLLGSSVSARGQRCVSSSASPCVSQLTTDNQISHRRRVTEATDETYGSEVQHGSSSAFWENV